MSSYAITVTNVIAGTEPQVWKQYWRDQAEKDGQVTAATDEEIQMRYNATTGVSVISGPVEHPGVIDTDND